jgi:hypothetical protein
VDFLPEDAIFLQVYRQCRDMMLNDYQVTGETPIGGEMQYFIYRVTYSYSEFRREMVRYYAFQHTPYMDSGKIYVKNNKHGVTSMHVEYLGSLVAENVQGVLSVTLATVGL